MKSTVQKWGNSLAVRIPKGLADELKLRQGTDVEITIEDECLVIKALDNKMKLDELLSKITDDNLPGEIDFGKTAGKEFW